MIQKHFTFLRKTKRDKFLVFGSPVIEEDSVEEVVDSLRSGWISTGPKVGCFEELVRAYTGAKHAVAVNSGSAALHLGLLAAGIGPGDEVITTPMTFAATAHAIVHVGARPVFADIELPSMNIDLRAIAERITPRTKAIIPVHFAGRPCGMDAIMKLAKKYHLTVIEDAAHAIGALYHGKKIGAIGHLTCFSFYVTKNIVTGEGGMVTTDDDTFAENIQVMALHGMSRGAWKRYSDEGFKHYEITAPGYKYNMMDIQAAIGLHQLPKIEHYLRRRQEIWRRYDEAFSELPVTVPPAEKPNTRHARHLYTLLIDDRKCRVGRDVFQQELHRRNIGTGIHFIAVHLHRYYRNRFGYHYGEFPNAEFISDRTISLPLSAKLTDEDVEDVITAVREILLFK